MTVQYTQKPWKIILGATIGNALEWYDFIVFGFLAVLISRLFFPTDDPYASLLLTTATLGAGFLMRPLGAVFFGRYADRVGRKAALTLVILLMFVATALIAFMPTYATIGIAAPILIVVARLLQGFSAGGEFGSATALLIEYAPAERKGFYGSWQMFAQSAGALLSTLMGVFLTNVFTPEALESWAWRIPFLFGLLIGPVGYFIRRHIDEPDDFKQVQEHERPSLVGVCARYPRELFIGLSLSAAVNVMSYVIITYLPIYAVQSLNLPISVPFTVLLCSVAVRMLLVPVFGHLSDVWGRKAVMIGALAAFLITLYPGYLWVIHQPGMLSLMIVELWFAVLIAAAYGPISTMITEIFPVEARVTGVSLSYNIAATIFGGFSPFLVTYFMMTTGSALAPAHYTAVFFVIGLIGAWLYVEQAPPPAERPRLWPWKSAPPAA